MKKRLLPIRVVTAIVAASMVMGDVCPTYAAQTTDTQEQEVAELSTEKISEEGELRAAVVNAKPQGLTLKNENGSVNISWNSLAGVTSYEIYRAKSRYGEYTKVGEVSSANYTDLTPNTDKYANYYKVAAKGRNNLSNPISLEIEMFGEDMYVFSPEDDVEQIYDAVNEIYLQQGGIYGGGASNAQQFGSGRYAFAFKTGDYSNMQKNNFDMFYYMQFIGLGKTPYDVTIRNIHVPATLPDENVTCNFWMDIENLSIAPQTEEEKELAKDDAQEYDFKWAVSQAAPARRHMYSVRRV